MTRASFCIGAFILGALLLTSGCRHEIATNGDGSPAPVVPVVRAASADLSNDIVLTAEFTPYQNVAVMAKVAGYAKAIYVDIKDRVRRGQLLATLDVPELQDELGRARGLWRAAQANISIAQGSLAGANAAAGIAHLSYGRIEDVLQKNPGLVPRQDVDVEESRDLEAKARVASAEAGLQAAQEARQGAVADLQRDGVTIDAR